MASSTSTSTETYIFRIPQTINSLDGLKNVLAKPLDLIGQWAKYYDKSLGRLQGLVTEMSRVKALTSAIESFYKIKLVYDHRKSSWNPLNIFNQPILWKNRAGLVYSICETLGYAQTVGLISSLPGMKKPSDLTKAVNWTKAIGNTVQSACGLYINWYQFKSGNFQLFSIARNVSGLALSILYSPLVSPDSYKFQKLLGLTVIVGSLFLEHVMNIVAKGKEDHLIGKS